MSMHVTAQQIAQYRNKSMPPGDLLAFDRHLAQCGECRAQLASAGSVTALLSGLEAAAHAPPHLSYDQLANYVDAKSGDVDREIVESHVEMCRRCATELGDLAAFAEMMSASMEADPAPLASQSKDLGAISFSKKTLRPKIVAGDDEENKAR
jgi:anti-sigma factor RsiW